LHKYNITHFIIVILFLGGRGGRGGFSESQQRNKGILVESQGKRTTFGDESD